MIKDERIKELFTISIKSNGNDFLAEVNELENTYGYSSQSAEKAIQDLEFFLGIYLDNEESKRVIQGTDKLINE